MSESSKLRKHHETPPRAAPSKGYIDTYYSRKLGELRRYSRLEGHTHTEVCIIGGGLAGLSLALALAERGLQVVLLEARRLAWGASGRNGGFVLPGFSLSTESLLKRMERTQALELFRLSKQAAALVRERSQAFGNAQLELNDGVLHAWRYPDSSETQRAHTFMRDTLEVDCELWPRERVREFLSTPCYHDALLVRDGFHLNPLRYALGIAEVAKARGVRLYEASAVESFELASNAKTVNTSAGRVEAKTLVFACGGYVSKLHRKLSAATLPVATYVMCTEPLGESLLGAVRTGHAVADTRQAGDYYRVVDRDRILWGGRMTVRDRSPWEIARLLSRDLVSVYPSLAKLRVSSAWSGLMGYARHRMPQVGRLAPDVWYSMGFGGHGINTTTMAGELIADAIARGDDRYRLLAPFGLDWTGGPLGRSVAQSTYWFLAARDRIREMRGARPG